MKPFTLEKSLIKRKLDGILSSQRQPKKHRQTHLDTFFIQRPKLEPSLLVNVDVITKTELSKEKNQNFQKSEYEGLHEKKNISINENENDKEDNNIKNSQKIFSNKFKLENINIASLEKKQIELDSKNELGNDSKLIEENIKVNETTLNGSGTQKNPLVTCSIFSSSFDLFSQVIIPQININSSIQVDAQTYKKVRQKKLKLRQCKRKVIPNSEIWDLTPEDHKSILDLLITNSRENGTHRIMINYRHEKTKKFTGIMYKRFLRRPQVWYFICVFGYFDEERYYLQKQCDEVFCYIHFYLLSKSMRRENYFENLTIHDHIVALGYIYENAIEDKTSGCLIWQSGKNENGYGLGHFRSKTYYMHRFSYQLFHEKTLSPKIFVCHDPEKCNNPPCLNPDHLVEGSALDNSQHRFLAGTMNLKYLPEQVEKIKELLVKYPNKSNVEIAKETKTSRKLVGNIRTTGKRHYKRSKKKKQRVVSNEKVREIRKIYKTTNKTKSKLAISYNLSFDIISNIVDNKRYKDIQETEEEQKEYEKRKYLKSIEELKDRLEKKVDKSSKCWIWQGYKTKFGYGRIRFKGKSHLAHVLSYMVFKNDFQPIPQGQEIRHLCPIKHNPSCINPEHLEIGTRSQNALDSVVAGTHYLANKPKKWSETFKNEIINQLKTQSIDEVANANSKELTYSQVVGIKQKAKEKGLL